MSNEAIPDPPVPAGTDLRDFAYTPVFRSRLFSSRFHARATDSEWRAGFTLWLKSWDQVPAGSLPDDDIDLCRLAELGRDMKTWRKVKATALYGWIKCSDGLLYHPTVAQGVNEALQKKRKQSDRGAKGAAARWGEQKKGMPQASQTDALSMLDASPKHAHANAEAMLKNGKGIEENRKEENRKEESTPKPSRVLVTDADPAFSEFWACYPRKDDKGHAKAAWTKALRKAPADVIIAGARAYQFSDDPRYLPLPTTWLNGERWKHPGNGVAAPKRAPSAWIDDLYSSPDIHPEAPPDLELNPDEFHDTDFHRSH
jgi:hypothetical protein